MISKMLRMNNEESGIYSPKFCLNRARGRVKKKKGSSVLFKLEALNSLDAPGVVTWERRKRIVIVQPKWKKEINYLQLQVQLFHYL